MKRTAIHLIFAGVLLALIPAACLIWGQGKPQTKPAAKASEAGAAKKFASESAPASLQTTRNLGKAHYEQGKYPEAIEDFQKVIATGQAQATDHLNLGLALMQANQLDAALGELTTAKQMDPKLVAVDYNLGILYKRELRYPDAEAALKRVIAADPDEPAAWFNLGTVYFAQKKLEEALDAHQHVVDMGFAHGQNFYVASLFHTFTTLVRLKRQPEAQKVLKLHEKMRDKVPGLSLQNPALEGGKYGAILVPPAPVTEVAHRLSLEKVTLADISGKLGVKLDGHGAASDKHLEVKASEYSLSFARQNLVPLFGPSVAVGDYNGDGHPDLYVVDPGSTNHLFKNNADGTFTDVTEEAGVPGPGGSLSATFVDFDNSGKASLMVAGLGGVKLYRNRGEGKFVDETEKAGLKAAEGELDTRAVLFDADNDGFLDLVVTAYTDLSAPPQKDSFVFPDDFTGAASRFYRNNGDGTFEDVTATAGIGNLRWRARGAVFADFDNNGYTDLVLLRDDGPPVLYDNQGEDKFVNKTAEFGLAQIKTAAFDAQTADFDHRGYFDLCLWTASGYQVLINRGGKFETRGHLPPVSAPSGVFAFRGAVADFNGDSFDDILAVDAGGKWHLIANRGGQFQESSLVLSPSKTDPVSSLAVAWLGAPGKLDVVAATRSGQVAAYEKEGPPARWMEVKLTGFKSNQQGVGSIVEFKAGNFYKKVMATGGQVRVYAGELPKLDVVRVTWPNAIVQNQVNVATNKPIEVRESETLASSCPLLYIWNGKEFVFLTDVLGVAPLGELQPDGTYVKPNPEEYVRLPRTMQDRNGDYVFQVTDELREADFVDQVRVLAVDHPVGEEIYSNEIYSTEPTPPTLYEVHEKRFPVSALDDHGHDVLALIREADGKYPADFRRNRILGLGDVHSLTLDLGEIPDPNHVALWLYGWVFWTDSNAARALMNNSETKMVAPYIQVRDAQGQWVTAIPDMGLPSGTNRAMRVDLSGRFLSPDHHVRIVTNFCVYWDQIFAAEDEKVDFTLAGGNGLQARATVAELPLMTADLHYRGFSNRLTEATHTQPDFFEYAKLSTDAPWNPQIGRYTRYGPVDTLLARADDRMVVMATGDELTVRFAGRRLSAVKPGFQRDFFLDIHGWAKDGEPNTAFSRTVAPLPFRLMVNYPPTPLDRAPRGPDYQQYIEEFQTRPGYALIPPLAPFKAVHRP